MNARKLKAAFVNMLPVICVDKHKPINNGYVKSVIYKLSDSGKVHCDGEIQDLNNPHHVVRANCRHIHFKSADKQIKYAPEASGNAHAESIRAAFFNTLPVIAVVPGMDVIECSYIIALVYTRGRRGNIICSCILQDANCPHSTLQARIGYIYLKSEYDKEKL